MNRSIKMDRRYTLGDYKYITLEDEVTDIPQDLAFSSDFVSSVRFLQLLSFEIAYRKYIQLVAKYPHSMDIEKAVAALEQLRDEEISKLRIVLNGQPQDDGEALDLVGADHVEHGGGDQRGEVGVDDGRGGEVVADRG